MEQLLGEAIIAALQPVKPDPRFVEQLGEELTEVGVARQRFRRQMGRALLILAIIAGGLLPILGILLLWWLWRFRNEETRPPLKLSNLFASPVTASPSNS
jgi:hypothetical protein